MGKYIVKSNPYNLHYQSDYVLCHERDSWWTVQLGEGKESGSYGGIRGALRLRPAADRAV